MRKLLPLSLIPALALASCNTTPPPRTYGVAPMPEASSPYSPQCQYITIKTSQGGQGTRPLLVDGQPLLTPGIILSESYPRRAPPVTVTAHCLVNQPGTRPGDADHLKVTGTSTATFTNELNIYVGSSEGSTLQDAYAATHTTSGIFPIIHSR
ncbi:hypothetical protein QOL99_13255 [Deinococcus sp. MIMF12]|uniref:Lipoprotein n=1 Tax=Deinococcus rhizophilus TaxID=3049544 RepID=A0ABT7JJ78_9DEIO|nr:hypothetical protein [Deinococcus rhizophilus]MDL2345112.1 hypothetical protein [Deinococcus rhizophilus]